MAIPQIMSKTGKQRCNEGSTELYCLFIAADSIVDALVPSGVSFYLKTSCPQIRGSGSPAGLN